MNRDYIPLALIVMDGWGEAPPSEWNAVRNCRPGNFEAFRAGYPFTLLDASGEAVGLPEGQIGNSEVGHLCLGAGRVVLQDLPRITKAVRTGELKRNAALIVAMESARGSGGALHLLGLFSTGGVHSHVDHLRALIEMSHERGVPRVFVHAFLDGRDVPPKSALALMREYEADPRTADARIATVQGRFYGMDRDTRWERIEKGWRAIVRGEGLPVRSGVEAIERAYERGETDEFVQPSIVLDGDGRPVGTVRDGDAIIHFNFRADRAREMTRALALEEFTHFDRGARPKLSAFCCLTEYDPTFGLPAAFPSRSPDRVFGEVIAEAGLRQVRMAETEKYAHVTYFFNGGRERPFDREQRVLVPSARKVPTYDLQPEMSAPALMDQVLDRIRGNADDFMLVNFANPDMVGHTGVYEAALKACRTVDESVGRIVKEILSRGGLAVVTSDHGNAEQLYDPSTHGPHTAHTTNLVPCIFVSDKLRGRRLREGGRLGDIAPTLLELLEIPQPPQMEGRSLLVP